MRLGGETMISDGAMKPILKNITRLVLAAAVMVLAVAAAPARGAGKPLSVDDVRLLLIGGATPEKLIALIGERGVDFQMTPELAKKLHDDGASDDVIDALQKAGQNVRSAAPAQAAPGVPAAAAAPPVSTAPPDSNTRSIATSGDSGGPVLRAAATRTPLPGKAPELSDPSAAQVQQIIQEFAAKEKLFKEARDNYTYHQVNKVQTLGPDNEVTGTFDQEWDILYDDSRRRIEHITYAPVNTLKDVIMTEQDLDAMRNIQPFVLTADDLPEYDVQYMGHVKVDQITAYVFSIRPKEMQKGKQYFKGTVWVDDRDLQIVKSEGKQVPELKTKNGENLFPRFDTWREQIDGKFWFPTFTLADDTLYFPTGPVHIKEIIRYSNYKQFKSKVRIINVTPEDQPKSAAPPKQ